MFPCCPAAGSPLAAGGLDGQEENVLHLGIHVLAVDGELHTGRVCQLEGNRLLLSPGGGAARLDIALEQDGTVALCELDPAHLHTGELDDDLTRIRVDDG